MRTRNREKQDVYAATDEDTLSIVSTIRKAHPDREEPVLPGAVKAVLEYEDSPLRFERFCIDLLTASEGRQYVPTSRTWDLGRDGKSVRGGAYICCSLSSDIDEKILADLKRIKATTDNIESLTYCTTKPLSEHTEAPIEAKLRLEFPTVTSVRILSLLALKHLAERHEKILRKHYRAELHSIEQALFNTPSSMGAGELGLKLALTTQTGDDARTLRESITERLVFDHLDAHPVGNVQEIAEAISRALHLPGRVDPTYLDSCLASMLARDLLSKNEDVYSLTEIGQNLAREIPESASGALLEGRVAIRESIESHSGYNLLDDEFEKLWAVLQDGLANLFYDHGLGIISMVAGLLDDEGAHSPDQPRLMSQLTDSIGALFLDEDKSQSILNAFHDTFTDKGSPAFDWLTNTCMTFVMLCSLGLESLSSREVTEQISSIDLVIDSDVVISLLCEREPNHAEVDRIIRSWNKLGGRVLTSVPILEEVAYHAWIAAREYECLASDLSKLDDAQASYLINNAFLRSFHRLSKGNPTRRHWERYLNQFRGSRDRDYVHVYKILAEEYGVLILPEIETERALVSALAEFLEKGSAQQRKCSVHELPYSSKDKCKRDGVLLATVAELRAGQLATKLRQTTPVVVSSSTRLRAAAQTFGPRLGNQDTVVTAAAVGCLLSLAPGVEMGLSNLRAVLFDVNLAKRLSDLEKCAYRVLLDSSQYNVPWGKRSALERELRAKLIEDAKAAGRPPAESINRFLSEANPERNAEIVRETLDRMAIQSVSQARTESLERELKEEKLKVEELQRKNKELREQSARRATRHRGSKK